MTKSRSILLTMFGIGSLVAGAVMFVVGLRAALQTDVTCADVVMQVGDHCRNHSSRGGGWYLLDYDGQRRHIHEDGLQFVAIGVVALFAGVAFVVGAWFGARRTTNSSMPSTPATPTPRTRFLLYYAFPILVGSIYPVGMFLTSDAGWPILLMIPAMAAGAPFLVRYGERKRREAAAAAEPGDQPLDSPPPEPREAGSPANPTRIPVQGIVMAVMLVAVGLYGLVLMASVLLLPTDAALCVLQVMHFGETCRGNDFWAQKRANLWTGFTLVVFCSLLSAAGWALIAYLRRSASRNGSAGPDDGLPRPYR